MKISGFEKIISIDRFEYLSCIDRHEVLEKEKYYFEYILNEINEDEINEPDNTNVYLEAIVTDNNDPDKKGRLQVGFETENIQEASDRREMIVFTQDGGFLAF